MAAAAIDSTSIFTLGNTTNEYSHRVNDGTMIADTTCHRDGHRDGPSLRGALYLNVLNKAVVSTVVNHSNEDSDIEKRSLKTPVDSIHQQLWATHFLQ